MPIYWYFTIFQKSFEKLQVLLTFDKRRGNLKPKSLYLCYCLPQFLEWKMIQTKLIQKIKHISYLITFPKNCALFEFFRGITAPSGPRPPNFQGFEIILSHITLARAWSLIVPSHRPLPDNRQHSQQTDINSPSGIRTRKPCKQAVAEPRLRPGGHRNRSCISWCGKM